VPCGNTSARVAIIHPIKSEKPLAVNSGAVSLPLGFNYNLFFIMSRYNSDPYFTTAKFNSTCPETGLPIKKGDKIAYFPRERKAYHENSKGGDQIREMQFNKCFEMADANW
jgi:hypothetical protein